jgi:hypothetical protein
MAGIATLEYLETTAFCPPPYLVSATSRIRCISRGDSRPRHGTARITALSAVGIDSAVMVQIKLVTGETLNVQGQSASQVMEALTKPEIETWVQINAVGGPIFVNPVHVISVRQIG